MLEYLGNIFGIFFDAPFKLYPITIVFLVGVFIQGTKVIIDLFSYKKFIVSNLFIAGGFPSFHSGISSCVTTLALLEYGFDSSTFAMAFVFSLLFSYDAMHVRYQAGQHAHYINKIRTKIGGILSENEYFSTREKLSERIGHTIWEVIGGILFGSIMTFMLYYYFVI
ncbi:MAG: hypothetical protein CR971_01950 [candidate division SR1 bacterium]|nr:MAG: hypothetical protein CR971_01950 [candidate division SR1 bacterium]